MKKFFFNLCSLTMLVMAMSANTYAQSVPTLYGVVYSEDMYWLASFEANETADFNLLFYDDDLEANGGVFYAEGLLYTHWLEYNAYGSLENTVQYIYDVKTGRKIQTREITSQSAGFTIAYDESEDCVYGYLQEPLAYDEEQYMYGRMNLHDGWTTELGRISVYKPIVVLAFNSVGEGYGVDYAGNFVKIDKTNGASTVIGSTGMVPAEVAQTATAALNAYSSAAAIPVVGYIIAPIAAAMAVAAGAMQVAAIKKQQQASQAQGYGEGGFTRKGRADEVAGVVHAGEWVASQKLVASPVARPLIEALDYAQRTNTIGSLRSADVSRSITAPMALAQSQPQVIVQESKELKEIIARLNERLDEPFVTVNTVTGDKGIKQAQDEYQRLMNNKSPKNKRK